ncbi:hypothetical protein [Nocardia huaxiensis]|uniref:Uncharacterized protein n=1 Tax=Nocardia huaxiensis TaxID=2755382 RepID=A0A7D6VAK9_9NOCA|nr:hypothetical protein [Nocardia huaxiensis]QLY30493.1 hypothetical protein H0264_36165 [Nocardia huaxiensis]UFS95908.1 hypothetical protein LPY97_35515 [Nocardia huaxiensis]
MNKVVRAAVAAVLAAGMAQTGTGSAQAEPVSAAGDRQEEVLSTRDGIVTSYVSLALPLPAAAPAHPAACDRIGYLRYRPVDGPADAVDADHVVVQQQGLHGGAVNSDSVAFNTVHSAKAQGQHIEYWALARRSSCLDEKRGFDRALETGNYLDAVDYYFNGMPIDGERFPGFKTSAELGVLDFMGLERVVRDQYELMLHEIPQQEVRQRKFVCTGISLGGLVTGFFSDWEFDGRPGADQCVAFAAQDSMISSDPVALQNTPFLAALTNAIVGPLDSVVQAGFTANVLPRTFGSAPGLGTRAFMLLRLAGLAAHLDPDGESQLLAHLPRDTDIEGTLNTFAAPTWAAWASNGGDGSGSIRDYRLTNAALLGVLIDNNSSNFSLFQQGIGALSGGPVQEKTFPNPGELTQLPLLGNFLRVSAGNQRRVAPTDRGALYTWRNYDDVAGVPWTAPNHEVADIRDVARQLAMGAPTAYWETYFPLRLVVDIGAGYGGTRTGDLAGLRYHGMARLKPNFVAWAGDSPVQPATGTLFPTPALAQVVSLPGYTHVDTIGAAAVLNDGQPDHSGWQLALFLRSLG